MNENATSRKDCELIRSSGDAASKTGRQCRPDDRRAPVWLARSVLLSVAIAAGSSWTAASEGPRPDRDRIVQGAARSGTSFWKKIARDEPFPKMGIRAVFSYALALAEARVHAERMERLFDIAARAQDRDPQSPGYGNFRWTWRDERVTDRNAVEFCMQDAVLIWRQHAHWLPEPARRALRQLLELSTEGCLRHRVATSYTNIALLNAGNLIALGETLERTDAAEEGYRRLDAICLWTWQFGTHEYVSPTYYGTDLDGLLFIESNAKRPLARQQASALLELFWTDIALNWFQPKECLAGPHSRSYDYLRGLGNVDRHLLRHGWLSGLAPAKSGMIQLLRSTWSPPERLLQMSRSRFPRLVRQSWGPALTDSRTHMLYPDVTLGASAAAYGLQDMPLTVDLPGNRQAVRCYFIADGRQDPYGRKKYETGSARHMKALHLKPYWTAAQRTSDVVGLVIYRPEDIKSDLVTDLQSHLVLRRDVNDLRLDGQSIAIPDGTAARPGRIALSVGAPLILRAGTAAIGIRVLWTRAQDGGPSAVTLVNDANPFGALRLTIDHRRQNVSAEAGAGLWIRVGSGLDDEQAFRAWCQQFEKARPTTAEASRERVSLAVPGADGPVSVEAVAPYGTGGEVLVPRPTRAMLELDGVEVGRPLLESIEPVCSYRERARRLETIVVPANGGVYWEAEAGLVLPLMVTAEKDGASAGHCVWQSTEQPWGRASGSVTWLLHVHRGGRYWLWGRVLAPDPKHDSFYVRVLSEQDALPMLLLSRQPDQPGATATQPRSGPGITETISWHTGHGDRWRWRAVTHDRSKTAAPIDLPAGLVQLQVGVREPGTKVDRLFLTSDSGAKPSE